MERSKRSCSASRGLTTGTLDTRFVGATLDPLSKVSSYDPQGSAIGAAYVGAWNSYVRDRWTTDRTSPSSRASRSIEVGLQASAAWRRQAADRVAQRAARPRRRDEAEPGHESDGQRRLFRCLDALFRRRDGDAPLAIPAALRSNIEYHYYQSGHMVYVHPPTLAQLHNDVADFIRRTNGVR